MVDERFTKRGVNHTDHRQLMKQKMNMWVVKLQNLCESLCPFLMLLFICYACNMFEYPPDVSLNCIFNISESILAFTYKTILSQMLNFTIKFVLL